MLRYFGGALVGFLAAGGVWLYVLLSSLGMPDSHGGYVLSAWYRVKGEAAREVKGPKIVLLGGSNVLFGLRAAEMQRRLGIPCVNFGTHAALPYIYLFSRARNILRRGDLLILSMEWGYLNEKPDTVTPVFSGQLLGSDLLYFSRMDVLSRVTVLLSAPPHRLLLPLAPGRFLSAVIQDAYCDWVRAHELNAAGDFIANPPEKRAVQVLEGLKSGRSAWWEGRSPSEDAPYWLAVGQMVAWAKQRGIRVCYAAPSMMARPGEMSPEARRYFAEAERHYAALGVGVLMRQADAFYPAELMFDSQFHLNSTGAAVRTEALTRALEPIAKTHFSRR